MKSATIYTTPTCHFCHMAKEYFQKHSVEYTEKDVTKDEAARNEMVEKTGQMGVPVIDIGGEFVIGFDQPKLAQLLEIKE